MFVCLLVLQHEWELIKENQISSLGYLGFTHLMFVKYVRYMAYYLVIPEYNEVHCWMGIYNLDLLIPKTQHYALCILYFEYTVHNKLYTLGLPLLIYLRISVIIFLLTFWSLPVHSSYLSSFDIYLEIVSILLAIAIFSFPIRIHVLSQFSMMLVGFCWQGGCALSSFD